MTGAPVDGLQQAVDALAARLGRSVAVDDARGELVVASRHFGDEDPLRTYAVLQRRSDPRVLAHFAAHDIHRWTTPGRIPAAPEIDFKARVACPVRAHGIPFGHLFLIDEDAVEDAEIELAATVAAEIGALLHGRLVRRERDHGRREAVARDLVSSDTEARGAAARAVVDEHLADAVEPAVALSVRLEAPAEAALRRAVDTVARGAALTTVAERGGTVLLLGASATAVLARAVADRLAADVPGRVVVGLGGVTSGPDAPRRSADEARGVAEAAALLPHLGDVVAPEDLGVYAVLLALPRRAVTPELYPPALRRLLAHDAHEALVDTLETYLDCCGDATRTATALRIHRSTLYYRLGRIESLAGVDLHDGGQRLALHLGVTLRRLIRAIEK
jgi:hypothetical protein